MIDVKTLIKVPAIFILLVLVISGCTPGGSGSSEPSAEDKQAFGQGFSQAFSGYGAASAEGDGTYIFDSSWTLNPSGCITVVVSGTSYSVTFDNCNFSGFIIDGTVNMSFTDLGGGAFDLLIKTNLVFAGNYTGTIGLDIAMSFNGSNYSFSGQVTINGEQFDIEEFAGELL